MMELQIKTLVITHSLTEEVVRQLWDFGELNVPVSTWGDYFSGVAQYENMGRPLGYNHGFIIEYETMPKK